MIRERYLADALRQLRKYKGLADRALAQLREEDIFRRLDPESNSIALLMKHLAGNMRSRWTDFLTTDGEKSDRNRNSEFEEEEGDTSARIHERWEEGWRRALDAVGSLAPEDLDRTVFVRREPHTVLEAINRQLTHYAYHVGQIVLVAKHFAGQGWQSLSIPRGRSGDFDVSKEGSRYGVAEGEGRIRKA